MTPTLVDFPPSRWTAIFRTPDALCAAPRPEAQQKLPAAVPLSAEDRDYLDHRFLRDWMAENPEALQSEAGAMMLRTLFQNRF
jgi:GrpB-like predicted nucleotidyltransferase (UPF0157 family)